MFEVENVFMMDNAFDELPVCESFEYALFQGHVWTC